MKDNESDLLDLEMAVSKYLLLTSAPKAGNESDNARKMKDLQQTINERDVQIDILNKQISALHAEMSD